MSPNSCVGSTFSNAAGFRGGALSHGANQSIQSWTDLGEGGPSWRRQVTGACPRRCIFLSLHFSTTHQLSSAVMFLQLNRQPRSEACETVRLNNFVLRVFLTGIMVTEMKSLTVSQGGKLS